ncbi:MAG: hypothetical protein ABIR67_06280 [Gaiellaceae bacterium]
MLPSLDRLAGLIDRVVELVDDVAAARGSPRERAAEPEATRPDVVAPDEWLVFVPSPQGYTLLPRPQPLPAPGEELDLDGTRYRVLRHCPSPLPGDDRRCAVVEEEPQASDRSFDA